MILTLTMAGMEVYGPFQKNNQHTVNKEALPSAGMNKCRVLGNKMMLSKIPMIYRVKY